jgi:O-antigen/teichoic acid export membrane protein
VGLYAVADRLMVAVALVPGVFNSALFPALSRLTRQDIVRARALVNGSLRLLMVVTVPLAALISLFAAEICGLMFGVHFIEAASALHLLAWSLPARGLLWLTGSQLTALDQQASMARGRSVSLVVFLLATPGLIWAFGFVGVACGVLISDGLHLLLNWRALQRVDQVPSLGRPLLGPVLASLAMLGASYFAMEHSPVVRVPVAVITMMAGLWVFGAVRVRDFEFLQAMFRSRTALAEGGLPGRPGAGSPPS